MRVTVEIEVEQLPGDRLLAFYQHIATAKNEDGEPSFEVSRSLTGMQFSAAQKVGDKTITHTFSIQPVIETVLAAIQEGESVRGCSCGQADFGAPGHDGGQH